MMNQKKLRIAAILLAAAMLLTIFPLQAVFAETTAEAAEPTAEAAETPSVPPAATPAATPSAVPAATPAATPAAAPKTLYEQLLAVTSAEAMYALLAEDLNGSGAALTFTAEQRTALAAHAEAYRAEEAYADVCELLEMLGAEEAAETYARQDGNYYIWENETINKGNGDNSILLTGRGLKIRGNVTLNLSGEIPIYGPIVVENGATLTIKLADGATGATLRKVFDVGVDNLSALISVNDGGNLKIEGAAGKQLVIDGNGKQGNFLYAEICDKSTFDFDNMTVKNFNGGGTSAGILRVAGEVHVDDCIFENNRSTPGYGGTLISGGSDRYCRMWVNNSTFKDNTSHGWGGGILWAANAKKDGIASYAWIEGCTFTGNTAQIGGGISNEANMKVTGCTFTGNKAKAGGGIATFPFTLEDTEASGDACGLTLGTGNKIQNNETTVAAATFNPGTGTVESGGNGITSVIYPSGGAGIWCYMNKDKWTCSMTIGSGNTISGNKSLSQGGGVLVYKEKGGDTSLTVDGATISGNAAPNGGGIALNNAFLTVNAGSEITKNTATQQGGGAYVLGGSFTMKGGSFSENKAESTAATDTCNGGGAYVSGGSVLVEHGSFTKNVARNGGGVYVNGGSFTVQSGTMRENEAIEFNAGKAEAWKEGAGGAVYANGGNITIGIQNCKQDTPCESHEAGKTTHHPIIKENKAVFGGGFGVNNGHIVLYCCNMTDNESASKGTGENVFMSGENGKIDHYINGATVGDDTDHGMVTVGGTTNIVHDGKTLKITIRYLSNDGEWRESKMELVWTGEAPKDYYLNLPYCPSDWTPAPEAKGYTFVGWTLDRAKTDDGDAVRSKGDYESIGTPVKIENRYTIDGEIITDNTIHFYALWAPKTNYILYARSLDGETIEQITQRSGSSIVGTDQLAEKLGAGEFPQTYEYRALSYDAALPTPAITGYTFKGWRLYADNRLISNWGWDAEEPILDAETGKPTTNPPTYQTISPATLVSQLKEGLPTNWTAGKIPFQQNFGEIVLVAVFEPSFKTLTIKKEVTGGTVDENQCFVFRIQGTPDRADAEAIDLTVSINGAGEQKILDLPVGNYTVTELTDWSWRYTIATILGGERKDNAVTLRLGGTKQDYEVTFTNNKTEKKWFSGDCYCENVWSATEDAVAQG